jgi:hypothetical protein
LLVRRNEREMPSRQWRRAATAVRLTAAVLAAVLLLAVAAACGGDDDTADADERPSSTTTTTLTPEAEVEQAYRDFIEMTKSLTLAPDPTDPEIAARSVDDARANLEANLTQLQTDGIQYRIGELDEQTVLSTTIEGDTATLSVCYVDHSGSFSTTSGAEIEPMRVVTSLDTTTLRLVDGTWRVSLTTTQPENMWEGEYSCGA